MKKINLKLMAAVISLLIAGSAVVAASYAWMTISSSPTANGISIALSGGKSILLAPDLTAAGEAGTVVHYPGVFESTLVFSRYRDSYGYLEEPAGLSPTSTADGIHWIFPTFDPETGELNPVEKFRVETDLSHANVTGQGSGGYVYLDFWVVSPGSEYCIRVSADKNGGTGSFLQELPAVAESETSGSGYTIRTQDGTMAACARVGFLVNDDTVTDNGGMSAYLESPGYDERYKCLKGVYQEKKGAETGREYRFTIYEPNALLHPAAGSGYLETQPLTVVGGEKVTQTTLAPENLTVQADSTWKEAEGGGLLLEQIFQSALAGRTAKDAGEARNLFYREGLQGQVWSYLDTGKFVESTRSLYERLEQSGGAVSEEEFGTLKAAGASEEGVIVKLERDTPQRVRMFLWLEGQDADCVNGAKALPDTQLALGIELAGADR